MLHWVFTWDPTQRIATRPLAIQKNGTWYTYGLDLTKNVCEVFGSSGYIGTAYTYTPYGQVTATGNVDQPIQWSSEYHDSELGLVYYNYRYYCGCTALWLSRDKQKEENNMNTYSYVKNRVCDKCDYLGLYIETIFDTGMIIYDLGLIGYGIAVGEAEMVDLGVDVASLFLPVPAGSTKVARVSTKPAVKPEIKQNKDFGGGQDGKGRCSLFCFISIF